MFSVTMIRRTASRIMISLGVVAIGFAGSGCVTAVGTGVQLVGIAVDNIDVKEREDKLIGKGLSAADEMFGERLDTLSDVYSPRRWVVYPVKLFNPLDKDRYVVEVADAKIVALSRTEKNSDPKRDWPRALFIREKAEGQSPSVCAKELDMGAPTLTVRDSKGLLSQIYDARDFKEFGSPDYCVLRFDENDLCKDVEFMGIGASTKKEPMHQPKAKEEASEKQDE